MLGIDLVFRRLGLERDNHRLRPLHVAVVDDLYGDVCEILASEDLHFPGKQRVIFPVVSRAGHLIIDDQAV